MSRTQKLVEQWNEDEAVWQRYVELRLAYCSIAPDSFEMDEAFDDWAWSEAVKERGPLDGVGFVVGHT